MPGAVQFSFGIGHREVHDADFIKTLFVKVEQSDDTGVVGRKHANSALQGGIPVVAFHVAGRVQMSIFQPDGVLFIVQRADIGILFWRWFSEVE